jgi:tRNAThr (cytosine32-N3)-methyltransferase
VTIFHLPPSAARYPPGPFSAFPLSPFAFRFPPVSPASPLSPYDRARTLIDAAHAADPTRTADGRAAEGVYADRLEAWVVRLDPAAPPLLRLAARCQHLERWAVPRSTFPLDKPGYLAWRRSLYTKQAERARALLLEAGVAPDAAAEVAVWVSKTGLKTNPGTQALEDAACLVFLENEIGAFAAQHADYPREKFVEILRKTWRKMSPAAREAALRLELPPAIAALVRDATAGQPADR